MLQGLDLASQTGMDDKKSTGKSTEDQMEKIDAIVGSEVLGYEGGAREEISGGTAPRKKSGDPKDSLADNRPEDLGKKPYATSALS